jgi:Zn-dependent peptidase ImmA (M78 family)/DNA-binding XRE family transcriptional regulator
VDRLTLSTNLRRLRISSGKSQEELARTAELSRVGYRGIETGVATPRIDTLARIAGALGVGIDQLLAPTRRLEAVRFRALKKMTSREELLVNVTAWLEDYKYVEELRKADSKYAFGDISRHARGEGRAKSAARLARRVAGLPDDGREVSDVCRLLEEHGVKVITPSVASEGFFGLSVAQSDGGPATVVNTWDRISVERRIFTSVHELAHLILHLDAFDVSKTAEDKAEEKEADTFASHFLMPEESFEDAWEEARGLPLVKRVIKVKRIFHVSYKTVLYRVAETRNVKNIWARFQAEYKNMHGSTLGAKDEPDRLREADFVTDRLRRLVRDAYEAGQITIERAADILDQDVATMRRDAGSWV